MHELGVVPKLLRCVVVVALTACATQASVVSPKPARATPEDPLAGWDATPKAPLAWSDFGAPTFARAKTERRFVVMDGSAEWCHWCHVIEAVTYHDPAVRELLDAHFIAAKVDVDARPDIEERYSAYGWPATVIFSPDGRELGKYKGFIAPERFAEILKEVVAQGGTGASHGEEESAPIPDTPLSEEHLAWIARATELDLEDYWDGELGSWGHQQKVPLFMTNAWALARAKAGDETAKKRVLFTLDQQLAITDPVWGGIYQYSTDSDWKHPHFEKLMYFNAGAIDNYAEAYLLTKDKKWLDAASAIRKYVDRFLSSAETGGFFVTQDADLNSQPLRGVGSQATLGAHESRRFMTGHEYYVLGEKERLALGVPRVDAHEYPQGNGLAIAAYARYFLASGDASALDHAKKAADHILATHATPSGALSHDQTGAGVGGGGEGGAGEKVVHLSDNAAFAFGLLALGEASKDPSRVTQAAKIVDAMLVEVEDVRGGGFFAHSKDPDAVGIFAVRRKPFEDNVTMLRVLARLARALPDRAAKYKRAIDRTLRAMATPERVKERGRMVGDFLLALEETKDVR
jgi:uncharacterized protein YyaL (SSP411 family)